MKPTRWLPLVAFCLLALLLASGVWMSRKPDRDALPSPLINKPAPDFALPVLHEPTRTVTLAELKGQPFLLNVWGSWCVECRLEHPVITRFAETRRVRVIGYNWKDDRVDALRWLEQFNNPYWLVLADVDGRAVNAPVDRGAPETFLVDTKGIIRWKHVGPLTDAIVASELMPVLQRIEATR
jgi:cytochrome c biogenesis protein CcmG/thiol:disulfide interchange protein DsbE